MTSVTGTHIAIVTIAGFACSIAVLISLGILVGDYVYLTMRAGSLTQKLTRLCAGSKFTMKLFFAYRNEILQKILEYSKLDNNSVSLKNI